MSVTCQFMAISVGSGQVTTATGQETQAADGLPALEAGVQMQVTQGSSVPPKASVLGVQAPSPPSCPSVCVTQSHKDTSAAGLAHPRDLILPYLCKGPISKRSPIPRSWGSGLQHVNVGDIAQPKRGPLAALALGGSDHPLIWPLASLGSRDEQESHLCRGQVSDLRRSQAMRGS